MSVIQTFKTRDEAELFQDTIVGNSFVLHLWHEDGTELFCVCDSTLLKCMQECLNEAEQVVLEERARVRDLLDSYEFQMDAEARARMSEGVSIGQITAKLETVRLLREVLCNG